VAVPGVPIERYISFNKKHGEYKELPIYVDGKRVLISDFQPLPVPKGSPDYIIGRCFDPVSGRRDGFAVVGTPYGNCSESGDGYWKWTWVLDFVPSISEGAALRLARDYLKRKKRRVIAVSEQMLEPIINSPPVNSSATKVEELQGELFPLQEYQSC
jgi:hypothetical protein